MIRRRRIAGLFIGAAAVAAALPIMGAVGAPSVVLPDLVADPPQRAGLAPEPYTYPDGTQALLLRFDGYIHNSGVGVLEMRGTNRSGSTMTTVSQYAQPTGGGALVAIAPPGNVPRITYDTGDGHNHWHLGAAARYSLWNAAKTAEVAPAMKTGFCLEDSERRETSGPSSAVYTDGAVRFCQQNAPTASSVYMGVSSGWRDLYHRNLAYQWVDVSTVQPGQYWVGAEVDPNNVITEASESNNTRAFSREGSVVPGYRATAVNAGTLPAGTASTITLTSQTFGSPGARRFRVTTLPTKGTLSVGGTARARGSVISGSTVTYTPNAGATGADQFDFTAYDSTSQFPRQPAAASVSLTIGTQPAATSVAISGAPASMVVSTSAQLTATVTNGSGTTAWSVNGIAGGNSTVGTVSSSGLYRSPAAVPSGGSVKVRATNNGAFDEKTITITATSSPDPAPQPSTNFVRNPSFEAGLTNWAGYRSSLSRVQLADAPEGTTVAKVAATTTSDYTIGEVPATVGSAKAGVTYTARAFVKAASPSAVGKRVVIDMREADATRYLRTVSGASVTLTNSFQPVTAQISGQAAGHEIDFYVLQVGGVSGDAFYVDAVTLTDGSGGTPPPTNTPPVADFTINPTAPTTGQAVTFTDTSTDSDGTVTGRAWDTDNDGAFDDGTGTTASRTFTAAGTYTVRLRATDDAGAETITSKTVTVTTSAPANQPPSASFTQSPANPAAGQAVTFTDTSTDSDGTVTGRAWDLDNDGAFDDGTGTTASRSFPAAGSYTVRLQATDDDGAPAVATRTVTVAPATTGGTNLVTNPSFETSTSGYYTYQASLTRTALADAPHGGYAVKVTRSSSGTNPSYTIDDYPDYVPSATAGVTYRVRAVVKAASSSSVGKSANIILREKTSTGTVRSVAGPYVTLGTTWQPVTAQISGQVAGRAIDFYIAQINSAYGNAFYVDDVSLTTG
jgi:PKD repeat protein